MNIRKGLDANEDSLCQANGEYKTECIIKYLDPRNLLEEALAISISSVSSLTNVVQD